MGKAKRLVLGIYMPEDSVSIYSLQPCSIVYTLLSYTRIKQQWDNRYDTNGVYIIC